MKSPVFIGDFCFFGVGNRPVAQVVVATCFLDLRRFADTHCCAAAIKAPVTLESSHDTGEFACEGLAQWWEQQGREHDPHATRLLILCHGGGEADDQQPRGRIAKAGDRQAQWSHSRNSTLLIEREVLAVRPQSRTSPARHDLEVVPRAAKIDARFDRSPVAPSMGLLVDGATRRPSKLRRPV